mmetsp:Transcript_34065/g.53668  ORF Transcript_34065/g.53668 Transcript_34065/m.53668 type:complete len:263 (+) Transcript_34065:621-1409(+)
MLSKADRRGGGILRPLRRRPPQPVPRRRGGLLVAHGVHPRQQPAHLPRGGLLGQGLPDPPRPADQRVQCGRDHAHGLPARLVQRLLLPGHGAHGGAADRPDDGLAAHEPAQRDAGHAGHGPRGGRPCGRAGGHPRDRHARAGGGEADQAGAAGGAALGRAGLRGGAAGGGLRGRGRARQEHAALPGRAVHAGGPDAHHAPAAGRGPPPLALRPAGVQVQLREHALQQAAPEPGGVHGPDRHLGLRRPGHPGRRDHGVSEIGL